jgi:hypothetical protein
LAYKKQVLFYLSCHIDTLLFGTPLKASVLRTLKASHFLRKDLGARRILFCHPVLCASVVSLSNSDIIVLHFVFLGRGKRADAHQWNGRAAPRSAQTTPQGLLPSLITTITQPPSTIIITTINTVS